MSGWWYPVWRDILRHRVEVLRDEFLTTADELLTTQEHVQVLLSTVVSMAEDVGLDAILDRVVVSACELVGAQYGALGVIGDGDLLSHFVTTGIRAEQIARSGEPPTGNDVFGDLIQAPEPLRPKDSKEHANDAGHPTNQPPMTTFLDVPIRVRGRVFGNLYLAENAGGDGFSDEDEALCIALAAAAGVAIENARLFDAAARRRRWMEAGMEANEQILATRDDGNAQILEVIAEHALAASDSSMAVIAFARPNGQRLSCQAAVGVQTFTVGQEFALPPVIAAVLTSGVPMGVGNASDIFGPGQGSELGPVMVMPLGLSGIGQGVVILARTEKASPYSEEDVDTSILFSSRVALAVDLVRQHRERESVLISDDRDRIARDLHDHVIQRIFAAGLSLQSLRRTITDEASLERLTTVTSELDESIRQLRETIYSLHPPQDTLEPLSHRLLSTINVLTADAGFEPRIHIAGLLDGGLSDAVVEDLMAVVTEGLSNAVRHSGAGEVSVGIDVGQHTVSLTITDDGDGYENPHHINGLSNIQHRATALGGTCSIDSTPGQGTSLIWTVPATDASTQTMVPKGNKTR